MSEFSMGMTTIKELVEYYERTLKNNFKIPSMGTSLIIKIPINTE